ncbi:MULTISPECIES: phosphopantetheine-binding protein [Actinomadura]|uniref:Phosphopantetheine-binding protein n=1 Tax=Actinomadura yumaensis TaxID=111807 RepID=A0ABW2CKP2_9ACTN|nr:phosphopantetheine-binding protein [Actinomadura sp. J1-007]MWK37136.1 hypothetical protein [Actinomadura sp. J1-007]
MGVDEQVTDQGNVNIVAIADFTEAGEAEVRTDGMVADNVEERLIAIVGKTLDRTCTVDDNLFELGAVSIEVLDVLARVREDFGVRVRLRDFYQSPTIRALGNMIGDAG